MSFDMARLAPEKAEFRPALPVSSMPGVNGTHMTKLTYKEQLLHPLWQRKRLQIMQRDDFTCQSCYDRETTLNVHHKHYNKGAMAWEYEDHELVTLCKACHEVMHDNQNLRKQVFAKLPVDGPGNETEAICLIAGWSFDWSCEIEQSDHYTLDAHSFLLGQIAALISNAVGYRVVDMKALYGALSSLDNKDITAWIQSAKVKR
jgi:hypothetical protein